MRSWILKWLVNWKLLWNICKYYYMDTELINMPSTSGNLNNSHNFLSPTLFSRHLLILTTLNCHLLQYCKLNVSCLGYSCLFSLVHVPCSLFLYPHEHSPCSSPSILQAQLNCYLFCEAPPDHQILLIDLFLLLPQTLIAFLVGVTHLALTVSHTHTHIFSNNAYIYFTYNKEKGLWV